MRAPVRPSQRSGYTPNRMAHAPPPVRTVPPRYRALMLSAKVPSAALPPMIWVMPHSSRTISTTLALLSPGVMAVRSMVSSTATIIISGPIR